MERKSRQVGYEIWRTNIMRTILGMIIGCLLTVGVVYVHDSMATSAVAGIATTSKPGAIVNWDLAALEWGHVKEDVHTAWLKLKANTNG
jgi:hypothetical protein